MKRRSGSAGGSDWPLCEWRQRRISNTTHKRLFLFSELNAATQHLEAEWQSCCSATAQQCTEQRLAHNSPAAPFRVTRSHRGQSTRSCAAHARAYQPTDDRLAHIGIQSLIPAADCVTGLARTAAHALKEVRHLRCLYFRLHGSSAVLRNYG
jgi:hypothetical protein